MKRPFLLLLVRINVDFGVEVDGRIIGLAAEDAIACSSAVRTFFSRWLLSLA
jgi:hypothetical protein